MQGYFVFATSRVAQAINQGTAVWYGERLTMAEELAALLAPLHDSPADGWRFPVVPAEDVPDGRAHGCVRVINMLLEDEDLQLDQLRTRPPRGVGLEARTWMASSCFVWAGRLEREEPIAAAPDWSGPRNRDALVVALDPLHRLYRWRSAVPGFGPAVARVGGLRAGQSAMELYARDAGHRAVELGLVPAESCSPAQLARAGREIDELAMDDDAARPGRPLSWLALRECSAQIARAASMFGYARAAARPAPSAGTPVAPEPPRRIELGEPGAPCYVLGREKRPLTDGNRAVIAALIEAGPAGMSKDALRAVRSSALRMLKELKLDPDWDKVIIMAGRTNCGYRVLA